MKVKRYKFVVSTGRYFLKQVGSYYEIDRIIIGVKDIDDNIIYPHPISSFLYTQYHRKSGSINTELTAAKTIVPFLNYLLNQEEPIGIAHLKIYHANDYLEYCVKEKGNKQITLNIKENYISTFYQYLLKQDILKEKPPFLLSKYYYKNKEKTACKLDFTYKKTDETLLREKVKRKDFVPQQHQNNEDRKIIRLNYIREFLLVAIEAAPDIAFAVALQFYGGLRAGEVLNLDQKSIITLEGSKYGERGMVLLIRDRQNELFPHKKSRSEEQVKRPRDQSVLLDPIVSLLYERHINKILRFKKDSINKIALFSNAKGEPLSYSVFYKKFKELKSIYFGKLLGTKGRFQDYQDFSGTRISTHIGRGAFTNMCLDAGFTARQTAILRGDMSVLSMESYKDQISASYNITRALGMLEPQNIKFVSDLNIPSSSVSYNFDNEGNS